MKHGAPRFGYSRNSASASMTWFAQCLVPATSFPYRPRGL
jgi:hypothetical protein